MKSFKITALSLVLVLLLAACGAKNDTPDEPAVDPTPEPPIEQPVEKTPDERINDIIADMSIEEKVGQLFFVRCPETGAAEDVSAYHLGGLLLFGRDYKDANGDWLTEDDSPRRSRPIRTRRPSRFSSAAMKRAARSRARAKIRTSSPNLSPPRRSSMPRAASTGCSNERSATTRSSKRSAST